MRSPASLLMERRAWSDDGAAAFLRNTILPRIALFRSQPAKIAVDGKPQAPRVPSMATIEMPTWAVASDEAAMNESAQIAGLYAGVPFSIGAKRHAEYLTQKQINRAGK